jgi:TolB-like protein/DNA-binding winged helix-turn-helix (wHTH) protein/Flp pilus assembly protein TadD
MGMGDSAFGLSDVHRKLRFGEYAIDLDRASLWRAGEERKLRPKSFEVLRYLAEHPQRLITKTELIGTVWPDAAVTDNSLVQCLLEIRRALEDDSQQLIKTVARRGYIFDCPVTLDGDLQPGPDPGDATHSDSGTAKTAAGITHRSIAAKHRFRSFAWLGLALLISVLIGAILLKLLATRERQSTQHALTKIRSIAVLPLVNLSRDPNQDLFADGMTEALITDLGKINSLRVISHTSVNRYKRTNLPIPQIAKRLQVDAIVEGTVTHTENRLRVTANLIQASPERHLWAEAYERDVRDVLAMQDEVAGTIAHEVQAKFVPSQQAAPRPVNPAAYEEYLWGRRLFETFTWDGVHGAVQHLDRAISLDPNFALAYATQAAAYVVLIGWHAVPPREGLAKIEAASRKALSFDNTLAEAHTAMAGFHVMRTEWAEAEREFQQAMLLNPNYYIAHDWHGYLLSNIGNQAGALAETKLGCQLDPLSDACHESLGTTYLLMGQYDEAIEEARKTLELNPASPGAHWIQARAYEARGRCPEAIAEMRKYGGPASLAYVYAVCGNKSKARAILHQLEQQSKTEYVSHYDLAIVKVGLGEREEAVAELEQADREGEPLAEINVEPWFNGLHKDSRFLALLRRHGFST